MATIEEKRLAIELAEKIIQTRISSKNPAYYKENSKSGDTQYWKETYLECLEIVKQSD